MATEPEFMEFEVNDLRLSEVAPIVGRALSVPPEDIAGFVMLGMTHDGAVGIACSANIDPHMAAHMLDTMARTLFDDEAARTGRAGQN